MVYKKYTADNGGEKNRNESKNGNQERERENERAGKWNAPQQMEKKITAGVQRKMSSLTKSSFDTMRLLSEFSKRGHDSLSSLCFF